jgi:uncharacterized protein
MMKYLLILAVLVVAYLIWKRNRRRKAEAQAQQTAAQRQTQPPPATPSAMLTCRHCGLHLPLTDATQGSLGFYCGPEHRRLAEG